MKPKSGCDWDTIGRWWKGAVPQISPLKMILLEHLYNIEDLYWSVWSRSSLWRLRLSWDFCPTRRTRPSAGVSVSLVESLFLVLLSYVTKLFNRIEQLHTITLTLTSICDVLFFPSPRGYFYANSHRFVGREKINHFKRKSQGRIINSMLSAFLLQRGIIFTGSKSEW